MQLSCVWPSCQPCALLHSPLQSSACRPSLPHRCRLLSQGDDGGSSAVVTGRAASPPESFNGSALEWVLRKADESLDEIEENPPEYAKVIYDLSTGPIGALTGCLSFLGCGFLWICCSRS